MPQIPSPTSPNRTPSRRVTARILSLATTGALGVAMLAATPAMAQIPDTSSPPDAAAVTAAILLYLMAVGPGAMPMDRPLATADIVPPPSSLAPSPVVPPVYRAVASLSSDAVVLELPFGDAAYDLRYMFFAASHGRRLVNGYSRVFPPSYRARQQVLENPLLDPERTAQALSVATHVIVHGAAWPDGMRLAIVRQLEALGGTLLERDADTVLFQMRATERVTRRWAE